MGRRSVPTITYGGGRPSAPAGPCAHGSQGTRSIKENENAPPEGGEFKNTPDSSRVYVALRKS